MATAPIDAVVSFSKTGSHFMPPEVDFHKPPEAVPTYMMSGLLVTTSMAVTRPDMPPGPMFLGIMFFTKSIENSCAKSSVTHNNITIERHFFIRLFLLVF